jgi:hypothetical protein
MASARVSILDPLGEVHTICVAEFDEIAEYVSTRLSVPREYQRLVCCHCSSVMDGSPPPSGHGKARRRCESPPSVPPSTDTMRIGSAEMELKLNLHLSFHSAGLALEVPDAAPGKVRRAALNTLSRMRVIGWRQAAELASAALSNPRAASRREAACTLELLLRRGTDGGAEVLAAALERPDACARDEAVRLFGRLGAGGDLGERSAAIAAIPARGANPDPDARIAVLKAILRLAVDAVQQDDMGDVLCEALEDGDAAVRNAAERLRSVALLRRSPALRVRVANLFTGRCQGGTPLDHAHPSRPRPAIYGRRRDTCRPELLAAGRGGDIRGGRGGTGGTQVGANRAQYTKT